MGRDMTGACSEPRAARAPGRPSLVTETLAAPPRRSHRALPAAAEVPAVRLLLQRAPGRLGADGQGAARGDVTLGRPERLAGLTPRAGAPVHFATTYKQLDMVRSSARRDYLTARKRLPAHAPRRLPALRTCVLLTHRNAYAPQLHHIIRNCRETVNQRDPRGLTALHRAAFLAQYDGYLQIYEYLLVRARAATRRAGVAILGVACAFIRRTSPLGSQSEGANPAILSNDYDPYMKPGRHAPADMVIHPEVRLRRDLFAFRKLAHARAAAGAQARAGAGGALRARAQGAPRSDAGAL